MRLNKNGIPLLDGVKNIVAPIHYDLRASIFKKTKGLCFYCGTKLQIKNHKAKKYMTIDHVDPKINGGTNNIHNLMPSCCKCNQMKGGEDIEIFINRIRKMPENQFNFKKVLSIGEVVKINGIPVTYLGDGVIGSNTDWEKFEVEESNNIKMDRCNCDDTGYLEDGWE